MCLERFLNLEHRFMQNLLKFLEKLKELLRVFTPSKRPLTHKEPNIHFHVFNLFDVVESFRRYRLVESRQTIWQKRFITDV